MPSTHRVLSSLVLAAVFGISAVLALEPVQEAIPNWSAPPRWSIAQAARTPAGPVETRDARARRPEPESLAAVPTPPLMLIGINPCRIADTRDITKPPGYGPPALSQAVSRNFTLTGQCGIAGTAQAVSLNITVTNTLGPGFISIYPQGGVAPVVSTLNYVAGQTVANAAVVPLGAGGGITVIAGVSGTDLIIDTNGYYDLPPQDPILGFARINSPSSTSTVSTFGGAGTTSVSVLRNVAGFYTVTFTGTYPSTTAADKIVVLSTAESLAFPVTNSAVVSATPTSIVVYVFTWISNVLTLVDNSFYVQVLIGR